MRFSRCRYLYFAFLLAIPASAQSPRLNGTFDPTRTVAIEKNVHPLARAEFDQGPADPTKKLGYITMVLQPTAQQQTDLETLLLQQQDRASANFHKWLTPEQFGNRFGMAASDVSSIKTWLAGHGFQIEDTARGRNWIAFSGTVDQVNRSLHTSIHRYLVNGKEHYANATNPSLPPELAGVVRFFRGLDDFQPEPPAAIHVKTTLADYTNSGGIHYLAPDDFATIYDITPLYNKGITGAGQSVAVLGRTDIDVAGYQTFRSKYNLPATVPVMHLVGPDPGTSDTDLSEAMLDLEWSGAVARNATIIYVYATGIDTAAQEAVDKNLAPVISSSYSSCEPDSADVLRYLAQQANAQGITWLVVTNDSGAAACDDHHAGRQQVSSGYAVSYPASIPEITAVGGTKFAEGTGTYWNSTNTANGGSAISYIPEIGWNDSNASGFFSGGGGVSIFYSKPLWQTGTGVPADKARDVPDISMAASASHDGYLLYYLGESYLNGGTSAATPASAGIVALLNQYQVSNGLQATAGMGNINPELYRMAESYPAAFHDITTGNNIVPCVQSTSGCVNGSLGYTAGVGYDLVTGLGSLDVNNLITHWGQNGAPSTTTVSATSSTVAFDTKPQLTASVAPASGSTAPTGTVAFLVPNEALGTIDLGTGTLTSSGGVAATTITVDPNQLGTGTNNITAVYSGDGNFDSSTGTTTLTVTPPANATAIVASCGPNPVYGQYSTTGVLSWYYTLTLTNLSGVAATLTDFTIGGTDEASKLSTFFNGTTIPAHGTLSAGVVSTGLTVPLNRTFTFSGTDASGNAWNQTLTVPFIVPISQPQIVLTGVPAAVRQNPSGGTSCPWVQLLTLQEEGGYSMQLFKFLSGNTDLTSQISQYFGSTQIAPFGALQASICVTGSTPPGSITYEVDGEADDGATFRSIFTSSYQTAPVLPPVLSAGQSSISLSTPTNSGSTTAPLSVNFASGSTTWTASIFPSNPTTSWLTISPSSGTGSGTITLTANAAGQTPGVYRATVIVQGASSLPQYVEVPVSFTIGASTSISIQGVAQGASFQTVFAPGMILSVFGTGLAPAVQAASSVPLPLSMQGVSATVNGVSAPLYYVSSSQINLQVPYETGAQSAVVGINNNGKLASFSFTTTPTAPGIFVSNGNLVPYASGSPGSESVLFMTGEGDVTPELITGDPPSSSTPLANLPQPRQPVTVTVGGIQATIAFIGIPSPLVGVTQINFVIPANVPTGPQPVVVTSNGVSSTAATLTIH
jgi:uncharacterized protein (TIGR03437 family)